MARWKKKAASSDGTCDPRSRHSVSSSPRTAAPCRWTQALIKGKWYDFDATLHETYTVGHVLVGTSSMSDKEAHNNHMQMAALIGNLEMDLLEVRHHPRR
jgi:hypothetical protein